MRELRELTLSGPLPSTPMGLTRGTSAPLLDYLPCPAGQPEVPTPRSPSCWCFPTGSSAVASLEARVLVHCTPQTWSPPPPSNPVPPKPSVICYGLGADHAQPLPPTAAASCTPPLPAPPLPRFCPEPARSPQLPGPSTPGELLCTSPLLLCAVSASFLDQSLNQHPHWSLSLQSDGLLQPTLRPAEGEPPEA